MKLITEAPLTARGSQIRWVDYIVGHIGMSYPSSWTQYAAAWFITA